MTQGTWLKLGGVCLQTLSSLQYISCLLWWKDYVQEKEKYACNWSGITKILKICDYDGVKINLMGPVVTTERDIQSVIILWCISNFTSYFNIKYLFSKF